MSRRIVASLIAIIVCGTSFLSLPSHASTPASSQQANAAEVANLVDRHNAIRRSNGLTPLTLAPKVGQQVSQPWSVKMASAGNLSHNPSPGWSGAKGWAENVAYTSTKDAPANLMTMWMESAGHRKNILNATYTVIAIGVEVRDGLTWATANFYAGPLRDAGTLHASGSSWLAGQGGSEGSGSTNQGAVNVYTTPGTHHVNGREWRTACAPYSQTKRCTTEIRATQVTHTAGRYVSTTGWVFNNMTYLPSPRSLWGGNNLGQNASWTSSGRRWRTECDTAATGRGGCRSYIWSSVVQTTTTSTGQRYSMAEQWVFNNIVQFS